MPVCLCYVTALPSGYTHSVRWTVHLESWPKLILCHPLIYRWIDWAWEWKASRHTHTVWACWTSRRWLGAGGVQLLFQYPFRGQRARNPFNYCLVFCISPPSPADPHSLVTSVSLPRLPLGTKTSFLVFPPKPVLAKWKPSAQTGVWAVTSCRTTALSQISMLSCTFWFRWAGVRPEFCLPHSSRRSSEDSGLRTTRWAARDCRTSSHLCVNTMLLFIFFYLLSCWLVTMYFVRRYYKAFWKLPLFRLWVPIKLP